MIVFGACIASRDSFDRFARRGIARFGGPDATIIETSSTSSILTAYNGILDQVRSRADFAELEALVLLHEDTEIKDPLFRYKLRRMFADPDVAVGGVIGARQVTSLAWWEGHTFGAVEETRGVIDFGRGDADVEAVDGLLLALSPWAVANLRFDEQRFRGFHAYDIDLCFSALAARKRVTVCELDVAHHTKGGYGDEAKWQANNAAWSEKWRPFIESRRPDSPRCSIVIPLFNKVEYTQRCIESLIENTPDGLYEAVLVDNGSTDGTSVLLDAIEGDDVVIIRNAVNEGFARACNAGAQAARTDAVLFLNNDTTVTRGWLEPMVDTLDARANVAVVGNKLLFPDGTIQHGGVTMFERFGTSRPDAVPFGPMLRFYGMLSDVLPANVPELVSAITGACMLVRKDVFFEHGGFDEAFWNGYEDVDLSLKIHRSGWDLFYEPRSVVYHYESASGAERFSKERANMDLFSDRWRGRLIPELVMVDDATIAQRFRFSGDRLPGQSAESRSAANVAAYDALVARLGAAPATRPALAG